MEHAPIVVHRVSPSGGRRVSLRVQDRETALGVAYSDADVIEFLRRAEVPDPDELVLGEPTPLVEWQGDAPYLYEGEAPDTDIP
ncbi:hypothetical protein OOK31_15450 [Streptomyces sp. NBC_00249]|uniref:hypothetical protein n=1 Tax=Streptomyces sp. NBC_00249 TaxID=2975690 RepID=UPI0022593538|nr:hypothetical protein [Streptomyces sp. NBC_00249]MCX5195282.1 hypothetical protein [Streptomyces sp. NBC_00249]